MFRKPEETYRLLAETVDLIFFCLDIYPLDLQESDGGAVREASNYLDLLTEMPVISPAHKRFGLI